MEIVMNEGYLMCELKGNGFGEEAYFEVVNGTEKYPAGTKIGATDARSLDNGKYLILAVNVYGIYKSTEV